jgi:hypothetical protein
MFATLRKHYTGQLMTIIPISPVCVCLLRDQVRLQRSEGISLVGKDSAPASVEELHRNMRLVTDFERSNTYPMSPASALREMVVAQGSSP